MTLCCISDTHGRHRDLDLSQYSADVLIHAGDWTKGRDLGLSETKDFLEWLSIQPFTHKIFIAGNHEVAVEASTRYFDEIMLNYPNLIYLQNSETIINGVKFYGSPYSNEFNDWAFMKDDIALSHIWETIPDDTQVLITHGPAYGCHDQVKQAYGRNPHVGSKSLHCRKLALQDTLKVHISGHIHEAAGTSIIANCTNICASVLNENYQLINKPTLIEM